MKFPKILFSCAALLCAGAPLFAADAPAANGYKVVLEIKIDETGVPTSASVIESDDPTPNHVLDNMAVLMAGKTKLEPRMKNGKAVPFKARMPFHFPIEGDEGPDANAGLTKPAGREGGVPVYPIELAEKGIVGGVVLELTIGADGVLKDVKTLRASHPQFEESATVAVKSWSFYPSNRNGTPVESRWRLAVVYDTGADIADLKWRVAPRPSLGSVVVMHDPAVEDSESAAPASGDAPVPAVPEPAAK